MKLNYKKTDNKVSMLDTKIKETKGEIKDLENRLEALYKERLELLIAPYKLGDHVLAEVPCGAGRRVTECLLENGLTGESTGTLYLRPFKTDGELSERRFSLIPVGDKKYKDYFEPVK